MINHNEYKAIGDYLIVKMYKGDESDERRIITMSDDSDSVLEGTVLSHGYEDSAYSDDYKNGDRILFNRMKSLPLTININEEVFLVRDCDVFAVLDTTTQEA